MKKKWIFAIAAVLVVGVLAGYFIGQGKTEDSSPTAYKQPEPSEVEMVDEVKDVRLTIDDSFFEYDQIVRQLWLIVEMSIRNNGENVAYFHFGRASRFYIQGADGKTYDTSNAHEDTWEDAKGTIAVTELKLYPGETQILTLQFFNVPENVQGLKLFCEISDLEPIKTISVAFEPRRIEEKPKSEVKEEAVSVVNPTPRSPSAVVARFYEMVRQREYEEAEQLISPDSLRLIHSRYGGLEKAMEDYLRGREIERVEITREEIKQDCGIYEECGYVDYIIYYKDGSEDVVKDDNPLIKINGEWMLP